MLVLAHRGLSAHYTENTQVAFEQALAQGAKAIECDVHQVGREFFIFHDYTLARLCGRDDALAELTSDALSKIKVKDKHSILRLSDFLALCANKAILNLELKSILEPALLVEYLISNVQIPEHAEGTVTLEGFLSTHPKQLVLSSFNHPLLQTLQGLIRNTRLEHKLSIAALIGHLPSDGVQYALNVNADIAACDAHLIDAPFVNDAHVNNLQVWCYTVNDEKQLKRLHAMGVDGIFSDDVKWANALISKICTDGKA